MNRHKQHCTSSLTEYNMYVYHKPTTKYFPFNLLLKLCKIHAIFTIIPNTPKYGGLAENLPEKDNLSTRDKRSATKVSLLRRFDCIYAQTSPALPRGMYIHRMKKHFKNEQRNRDDAAKKRANTSGVGKSNNYYEDIYLYSYLLTTTLTNHTYTF